MRNIIVLFVAVLMSGCFDSEGSGSSVSAPPEVSFEEARAAEGTVVFDNTGVFLDVSIYLDENFQFGSEGSGQCGPLDLEFVINTTSGEELPADFQMYKFWVLADTFGWSLGLDTDNQLTQLNAASNTACGGNSIFETFILVDVAVQIGNDRNFGIMKAREITILPRN